MPVHRSPDGKIIEEKTGKEVDPDQPTERAGPPPATPLPAAGGRGGGAGRLEEPTRLVGAGQGGAGAAPGGADRGRLEEKTRLVGAGRGGAGAVAGGAAASGGVAVGGAPDDGRTRLVGGRRPAGDRERPAVDSRDAMEDPVVGWLVVVAGPGKGNALRLGYGANSMGRGRTDRVSLDFGDDRISRSNHATVIYDPRGRQFHLQPGEGTNLTYLGDQLVLSPVALPALAHIVLGDTTLRFVPLCGDAFDWQDSGDDN